MNKVNLTEATRSQLISKSRNADLYKHQKYGKNRFERKKYSKVATQVKSYNTIDMNDFFKRDILTVNIPVTGETNEYLVSIQLEGVMAEIAKNIKANQNKFEFRTVIQSLTKIFNIGNVKVKCNCQDFCLHEDTKIKLLNGLSYSIKELSERFKNNALPCEYLFSTDEKGDFKPGKILNIWQSGLSDKMIKITLDNNESIITTPNHLYMLRNGEYRAAEDLIVGQSLMPLYFSKTKNGYDTIKSNSELTTTFYSIYKIVADELLQKEIEEAKIRSGEEIISIHHKDFNKQNNDPSNLLPMGFNEHYKYHYDHVFDSGAFDKFKAGGEKYRKLVIDRTTPEYEKQAQVLSEAISEYRVNMNEEERQHALDNRSKITKEAWESGAYDTEAFHTAAKKRKDWLVSDECQELATEGVRNYWKNISEEDKAIRFKLSQEKRMQTTTHEERSNSSKKGYFTLCKKVFEYLLENKLELTEENYEKYKNIISNKTPHLKKLFSNITEATSYFELNHKITDIEIITYAQPVPVYDIEVEKYHNFMVDSGVILHNCYRFAHQLILNGDSVDGTDKDPGPGKTGMANTQGKGCKHILLVLNNQDWLMKTASVINNYINYMQEHNKGAFLKVMFPKMYGIPASAAEEENLVPEDTNLETDKNIIDTINTWGRDRGKIKKGSNKNPVAQKQKEQKAEEEKQ